MSDAVTLLVPAEERYRALAPEIARKYLEIAGGSPADAASLAESVAAALATVASGASAEAGVALAFAHEAGSVEVRVECGGQSATVSQELPAGK